MQYFHKNQQIMYSYKPKIMYNQPWDPYYMPDWPPARVQLFLRRLGLRKYVRSFEQFGIDGAALVLMDDEDFDNLEVWSRYGCRQRRQLAQASRHSQLTRTLTPTRLIRIHRKKIVVEKDKIYLRKASDCAGEAHVAKVPHTSLTLTLTHRAHRSVDCAERRHP